MRKLKNFREYYEFDDDLSLSSLHQNQLKTFQTRLDNVKTEEDIRKLKEDAEQYEKYTDIEDIIGPWEDFMVYLGRKMDEMMVVDFDHPELNEFLEKLKNVKSEAELEKLSNEIKKYAEDKLDDPAYEDDFDKFNKVYAQNIAKILEKIAK